MFITPAMRSIIEKIDAIEEKYGDDFFPAYSADDWNELNRLGAEYEKERKQNNLDYFHAAGFVTNSEHNARSAKNARQAQ